MPSYIDAGGMSEDGYLLKNWAKAQVFVAETLLTAYSNNFLYRVGIGMDIGETSIVHAFREIKRE